jgi:hypothetical protein
LRLPKLVPKWEFLAGGRVPPSPNPFECLAWRGFCKNAAQNLEPQGFKGQNIDFKELVGGSGQLQSTAFAATMMGFLAKWHKVRCHIESGKAVEICRARCRVLLMVLNRLSSEFAGRAALRF